MDCEARPKTNCGCSNRIRAPKNPRMRAKSHRVNDLDTENTAEGFVDKKSILLSRIAIYQFAICLYFKALRVRSLEFILHTSNQFQVQPAHSASRLPGKPSWYHGESNVRSTVVERPSPCRSVPFTCTSRSAFDAAATAISQPMRSPTETRSSQHISRPWNSLSVGSVPRV